MAGITCFVPVAGLSELALFGVLALACGLLGWKVYGAKSRDDAASDLHDLSREWIGRTVQLAAPIENGIGQARFGDSVWRVAGADAPAGASVRVTGIDGTTLLVEPL